MKLRILRSGLPTLGAGLLAFGAVVDAGAVVPETVTHQGRLFDAAGLPVTDALDVTFSLYDSSAGGNPVWSETILTAFEDGYYSVHLGESASFMNVLDGSTMWMGMRIEGDDEMTPRARVGSVPYAMVANDATGDINPLTVNIQGYGPVIDENGQWVGEPTGLVGPAGPAGSSGVVGSAFASGPGLDPAGADLMFLAETVTVTVAAGEAIHVTSHKALGSTAVNGAAALDLWICYRESGFGGLPSQVGTGIYNQRVPQYTRIPFGLSARITGLVGTYDVGLCGDPDGNTGWNSNEYSYTTALLYLE